MAQISLASSIPVPHSLTKRVLEMFKELENMQFLHNSSVF